MRPALKPGLLPVWRDRDTLQIGIDSRRAVALTGMAGIAWVIGLLDGSRDRAQVIQAAEYRGVPRATVERVLSLLASAGALDDFPAATLRVLSPPLRTRLAAELATVSLARRDGDGGARTLARRLAAQVRVFGSGRVGSSVAHLLTTSGVSCVTEPDPAQPPAATTSARARAAPAGPGPGNAARARPAPARHAPASQAPARHAPASHAPASQAPASHAPASHAPASQAPASQAPASQAPAQPPRPDLAVLTAHSPPELQAGLMRGHVPHLVASASEAIGIVGPLVIPGRTACLRCLDLARTDRDPSWPLILAQLAGRAPDPMACDAPLAAAVAAQAAIQALAFIDRAAAVSAVRNGTLELVLPSWQWRRRTWPPHRDCACGGRDPSGPPGS